ncbi:MAG: hypothetical protein ABI894_00640 [Ilumatobacteraceae bacterium]
MRNRHLLITAIAAASVVALIPTLNNAQASNSKHPAQGGHTPVEVEVFAPERHDNAGTDGKGWLVDLEITYPGTSLATAGFSGLQLTGPAAHNNVAPFPGTFSTGQDDRLPGLVVMTSTTNATIPGFSGAGTNLANLFNLTGVTDRTANDFELWDTWIVGAPIAGTNIDTTLTVAVIADLNGNGIYDDAPPVVTDLNGDGTVDKKDLKLLGVASNIVVVPFHINGDPAR